MLLLHLLHTKEQIVFFIVYNIHMEECAHHHLKI